jgi:hypothetical protein
MQTMLGIPAMTCRQIVGAPAGGLLHGGEHECGREATLVVRHGRKIIARVCTRHAIRFRRMAGYTVNEMEE